MTGVNRNLSPGDEKVVIGTLGDTMGKLESVRDQQIRVDGTTANEMVIEAKTQRTTIKALIERLWSERKERDLPFFVWPLGIQFKSASDETVLYTRLAASILAEEGHRDRGWLIGALDMIARERKQ